MGFEVGYILFLLIIGFIVAIFKTPPKKTRKRKKSLNATQNTLKKAENRNSTLGVSINYDNAKLYEWNRKEEIRKRIQNSYPSRNGLKIPEIMVLSYAKKFTTNQTEFQSFWEYEYNVDNPQKILKELLDKGFICISSTEESFNNFKVAELKDMLKELGLKQSGKKLDLIKRIIENADNTYLESKIKVQYYDLTDLGKQELSENEYVTYFHKKKNAYGVDVFWVNNQIHNYPGRKFRDLIWGELNRKTATTSKEMATGNYESYIWNRSLMCDFLLEEKRNYSQALMLLSEEFYYDFNIQLPDRYLNKLHIYDMSKNYKNSKGISECPKLQKCVAFDILRFKTICKELDLSNDDLFQALVGNFSRFYVKNPIISNIDLAGLIVSKINEDNATIEKVLTPIENQLKSEYAKFKKGRNYG